MKTIYKHLLITFLFLGNVCFLQAQTTGNFTTLQNLISGTAANGTLTLTRDYVADPGESRLTISKNITIDLNGHIVNRNLTERQLDGNVIFVNSNVTLTINDSRPTATHSPAVTYTNPITQVEESIVGGIIMGGNTTTDGGGIMVTEGGRLTMNGGSIAKNRSIRAGGGVFNSRNSTFTMTGGAIVGNMAGSYDDIAPGNGYGGGVCNGETGNSSLAQFTMTGGIIAGNTAKLYGGGVYNNHKARCVMRNSKISENEANSKSTTQNIGGGIYNYAYLEIDHSIITGNRALSSTNPNTNSNGGGIYGKKPTGSDSLVMIITHSEISGNQARYSGGGISITAGNQSRIKLVGNTIQENIIYVSGGGLSLNNSGTSWLILKDNLFIGNEATTHGGAIFMSEGDSGMTIEMGNNIIRNNTANYGGGIQYSATTLELNSDSIINNTARYNGGGVCVGNMATFIMKSGSITNNTASYGGGVYMDRNSIISIEDGSITNNTASYGGGVSVGYTHNANYNSTMTMTGGTIANNSASWGGGVHNCSALNVSGGTIADNSAQYGGGVANMSGHTFNFEGGSILRNEAVRQGGGIMNQGTVNFSNGTISYNQTTGTDLNYGGGGVYNHGTFFMENGTISNNTSARFGGGVHNHVTFELKNGLISDNTAKECGGGVYNSNNGTFTMENGTISGNSTTSNNTKHNGGGVYNDKTFTLIGGTITENTSTSYGGGVSNARDFVMQGGTISSNSSQLGGGVYNYYIQNNNSGTGTAVFTMTAGQIINNTASSGQSNGIYQSGIFNLSGAPEFTANDDIYLFCNKRNDDESGVNRVITKAGDIDRPAGYFHIVLGDAPTYLYHGRNIMETGDGTVVESDRALFTIDNFDQCKSKFLWDRYLANDPTTSAPVVELFSPTWVGIVTQQPTGFNLNNIDSKEDLAWLISYVNGYNGQTAHPNATAVLTADVDMGDYEWVPIGTGSRPFGGTFNGQGNTISNLRNTTEYVNPGMFGKVSGTVTNTFVASSSFVTRPDEEGYYGIIADTLTSSGKVVYSEACGALTASASNAHIGGIVGLLSGTNSTMHSCTSIADLTGYEMGGLACRNEGSVANSLSYPKFTYSRLTGDFVGGLVADNSGSVSNCYLRRDRGNSVSGASYNPLVANGTDAADSYEPADYSGTQRLNGKYKYGQQDQMAGDQCLLDKLNGKVVGNHARWTRTMASTINNDYPVLALPDFTCIAQIDTVNKLFMEYKADLNAMIRKYNATTEGTNVCLYGANGSAIDTDNSDQVKVYVCENVGLLQAEGNRLNATVGVTFDNSDASDLGGKPYDWHMFATPLQNAPMGISYADNIAHGYMQEPTAITLQANGYFPTDSPYGSMDFYCYSEQYYHWINFKRNSADHWHQDGAHDNIPYTNETTMVPAKGYMMAIDKQTTLMNKGTLTNGDITYPLSYTDLTGNETPFRGCNLIGNPYQSYLDFDELVSGDIDSYYIIDADHQGYIAYTKGATESSNTAPRYLHPHQGFFVRATASGQSVRFTNSMRQESGTTHSNFRGGEPIRYPLVNLVCTDPEGMRDYATVELDRPEKGGGKKVKELRTGNASLRIHLDDTDYQIAFAPMGTQEVPVHFAAYAEGIYTLGWSTENGDFSYLHLIDNITGADIDCLERSEYQFAASPSDYKSRFKLKLRYSEVEEPTEVKTDGFAFPMGDEVLVNGEGLLEIFDINGRLVKSVWLSGMQTTIHKPQSKTGLFLFRLTNDHTSMTQKIVL